VERSDDAKGREGLRAAPGGKVQQGAAPGSAPQGDPASQKDGKKVRKEGHSKKKKRKGVRSERGSKGS